MVPLLEVFDCSTGIDLPVGTARFSLRRRAVSTTFSYSDDWLLAEDAYAIDPSLPLMAGLSHCPGLPGAFRDSSPDRWGRTLIERNHRDDAATDGRTLRRLDEVDYLLGVFDRTREGSLRFREPGGAFLAASSSVPPVVQLPRLVRASHDVARHEAGHAEVKELLDAGSGSLGGARPKASVVDGDKLLLAKFSHPEDEWDVMAWEKTMLDMAAAAGIDVPAAKLVRVGDESVLLLDRFDRDGSRLNGRRVPYMSAMTALGSADGEQRDYAELAEAMADLAKDAASMLEQMFVRVVFSVAVANTDDHLRNWGFLRRRGWGLAPMFDVNPNPYENVRRATSIAGELDGGEARGLIDLAAYGGIASERAAAVTERIVSVVRRAPEFARKNACAEKEVRIFQPVFACKAKEIEDAFL